MWEVLEDTIIDSIRLLPFLLITYFIMEYIEHKTSDKVKKTVQKSGKFGPFIGGILGIFPQCGFSAAVASLYAGKIISLGTLIAIFLSTSDEMLPVLISEAAPIPLILQILAIKLISAIIIGFSIDFIIKAIQKKIGKNIQEEKVVEEIGHICEHEHCHCEEEGIFKSALKHTLHIFVFIFIVTLIINIIIHFIGEENLSHLILNVPILGPMIAGLMGLIPNCAGSVILTQLFLKQVISFGSMMGGLLVGSGIGILVLYRTNKNLKENIAITALLYLLGTILGILIDVIGFPIF